MKDQRWLEIVNRLSASYSALGRAALDKMSGIEIYLLYADKMADLNDQSKKLAKTPEDELGQLRKAKLEREVNDVGGFLKDNVRTMGGKELNLKQREGPELER